MAKSAYVVLQNIMLFRSNWLDFPQVTGELILIVNQATLHHLPITQQQRFSQLVVLESFDYLAVAGTLEKLLANGYTLHCIATHDETIIQLAAQLRQAFNVPGEKPADVSRFLDKLVMKQYLNQTSVPYPKHLQFDEKAYQLRPADYLAMIQQQLTFPVFAKPTNSAASIGTAKLNNLTELADWCASQSGNLSYELDEYITGTLLSCESIIFNNQILFSQTIEYMHPCFEFMQDKLLGAIILPLDDELNQRVLKFNQTVLNAMEPVPNGVTHLELFKTADNRLIFLELACRPPGGMIGQSYHKRFNINLEQIHYCLQMGLPIDLTPMAKPTYHTLWAWFPYRAGIVSGYQPLAVQSPHEIFWKEQIGAQLPSPKSLIDYAGGILVWHEDYQKLLKDFHYLANLPHSPLLVDQPVVELAD